MIKFLFIHRNIESNNSGTKVPKVGKFWLWVVQVLVMTSSKFDDFSVVCSVFINVHQRPYNYKICIYT